EGRVLGARQPGLPGRFVPPRVAATVGVLPVQPVEQKDVGLALEGPKDLVRLDEAITHREATIQQVREVRREGPQVDGRVTLRGPWVLDRAPPRCSGRVARAAPAAPPPRSSRGRSSSPPGPRRRPRFLAGGQPAAVRRESPRSGFPGPRRRAPGG